MKASNMIKYYITDVTNRLPRNLRDDVGFELGALLQEQLQEQLQEKIADHPDSDEAELTRAMLQAFGHPHEVAARYRPPIEIIDPVDSHSFVFASIAGIIVLWVAGLADVLKDSAGTDREFLTLLSEWWLGIGLAAFWWPGFLVVFFAIAFRVRKRWPQVRIWHARKIIVRDPDQINRAGLITIVLFYAIGLAVLISPASLLDFIFDGLAAPAAYQALSYAPEFYPVRAVWLFGLLLAGLLVLIVLIIQGRWSPILRRIDMLLAVTVSVVLVWNSAAGNIFASTATDQFVKVIIGLIVFFTLLDKGMALYRELQRSYSPKLTAGARI